MSEVAGKLAPQMGAWTLQKANGGRGVLLGGVPGVAPGQVAVIGGGVVGTHAARVAAGMGADVVVLDASLARIRYLDDTFAGLFRTRYASRGETEAAVAEADLVIGAVLIPGAAAPKLVTRAQLGAMKPGAAIVDVAIDQAAASRPRGRRPTTTRSTPLTASCTTASPTCRELWRAPPPWRSATQRCPTCWRSPTRAGDRLARMTRICWRESTPTPGI
jgi:alanine dehydrogenase